MRISDVAKALGALGGLARARRLSAADRQRIAALGGHARRRSLEMRRRIIDTMAYAKAADELRRPAPRIVRVSTCRGPLPGLYARRD